MQATRERDVCKSALEAINGSLSETLKCDFLAVLGFTYTWAAKVASEVSLRNERRQMEGGAIWGHPHHYAIIFVEIRKSQRYNIFQSRKLGPPALVLARNASFMRHEHVSSFDTSLIPLSSHLRHLFVSWVPSASQSSPRRGHPDDDHCHYVYYQHHCRESCSVSSYQVNPLLHLTLTCQNMFLPFVYHTSYESCCARLPPR